jgi:hypothetical protein
MKCDIASLDARTRAIEASIEPSSSFPPTVAPTWDGLAWRIARVERMSFLQSGITRTIERNTSYQHLVAQDTIITIDDVDRVVADLAQRSRAVRNVPWRTHGSKVAKDDNERHNYLRQELYYILGMSRYRCVTPIPTTLQELYVLATEATLEVMSIHHLPFRGPPAPGGWPGSPIGPPLPPSFRPVSKKKKPWGKRTCTRCSRCSCHDDGSSVSSSSSSISDVDTYSRNSVTKHPIRRFFKFGWLRPLACWKREKQTSGSDTDSTM